ncbi:MAG: AAA family ATPase [Candidatus Methanomethylicaceae archaeon]
MLRKLMTVLNTIDSPRLTPCLIGPTGSGKTSLVENYAHDVGKRLVKVLPGTELPEEILGLPRPTRKDGVRIIEPVLRAELLLAVREACVLFLDELDKAREETHAAILTLLASREIRGHKLHAQTEIVCAMQPVSVEEFLSSETGKALSARLVFLSSWSLSRSYIEEKYGISVLDLIPEPNIILPILPESSLRQIEWSIKFITQAISCGLSEEEIKTVLRGVFPEHVAEELLSRVLSRDAVDPWSIAKERGTLTDLVHKVPVGELCERLAWIWLADWQAGCEALVRVATETDVETASVSIYEALKEMESVQRANGTLEWDVEENEGVRVFSEALERIAKKWQEQ